MTVSPRSGVALRIMTTGRFYVKFDPELSTKVEENFSRFSTVIYTPSNGQRSGRNDF
jgi:hypothetical protein